MVTKPILWGVGLFGFVLGFVTWLVWHSPALAARPDLTGYLASIIGGLVGGGMTLFAGWLAWTAAQRQINAQYAMLALATDEHRKRVLRLLHHAGDASRDVVAAAHRRRSKVNILEREVLSPGRLDDVGWESVIADPDFWRLSIHTSERIRGAQTRLMAFNERTDLSLVPPPLWNQVRWAQLHTLMAEASVLERDLQEERFKIRQVSESLAHPPAPPAP